MVVQALKKMWQRIVTKCQLQYKIQPDVGWNITQSLVEPGTNTSNLTDLVALDGKENSGLQPYQRYDD